MANAAAARKVQPEGQQAQAESICKVLYGMDPCEHMFLLPNRIHPKEHDGESCSGGLPEIPYDGGIPDEIIRREYQRGTYRTQIVIKEPGKRPTFAPGAKIHMVEIPEGEPFVPRASRTQQRTSPPRRDSDELAKLRDEIAQLKATAVAQGQPQPGKHDPTHDKLRRLVRAARAQVAKLEREREEERRAQRERDERARDRAELAQVLTHGAQAAASALGDRLESKLGAKLEAIAALGDHLDTALEDTKGALLDEVDERFGKLAGAGAPTDRYAMVLQAAERGLDKYAEVKKEERATLLEERLKEQEREREIERGKLLAQLGQEQERARQLEAELQKKRGGGNV